MKMHMVAALNNALELEMKKNEKIVIIGEDVGVDGGVFRVTEGLIDKFTDKRVIDTPLSEAGIIGSAVGLAVNGIRPVCEMQFIGFAYQGFAQVKQHLTRMRQRSYGRFTCPVVIRGPAGGGIRALEHHCECPETFFGHTHGIKVVFPSGPYDAKGLLTSALRSEDPVMFLEPEKLYRSFKEEVPEDEYSIPLGEANVKKEGKDLTLITYGPTVKLSMEAAEKSDIDVEVIDLRTVWPLDMDTILKSIEKTGRALVVHEAPKSMGMGAEISARIQEKAIYNLEGPIVRVGAPDVPYPQFAFENYYLVDVNRIQKGIEKAMR